MRPTSLPTRDIPLKTILFSQVFIHHIVDLVFGLAMNYSHHSENFVNPSNGAHTQTIEGVWETRVKRHMKAMRGVVKDVVPEILDEFLWHSWFFDMGATEEQFMCGICQSIGRKSYR